MSFKDKLLGSNETTLRIRIKEAEELRDKLNLSLQKIEDKSQFSIEWINENKQQIIFIYDKFVNALIKKDEKTIRDLIKDNSELSSIALSIPVSPEQSIVTDSTKNSFKELASSIFDKTELTNIIEKTVQDLSNHIHQKIDREYGDDETLEQNNTTNDSTDESNEDATSDTPESSVWDRISGNSEKNLERHLERLKREQSALQTSTPYYIDSFFDWVEDSTLPKNFENHNQRKATDNSELLIGYKDPEHMIKLAETDLDDITKQHISDLKDLAWVYTSINHAVKDQDAEKFSQQWFSTERNDELSATLTSWLTSEHDAVSIEDLIVKKFDNNETSLMLLANLCQHIDDSNELNFSDCDGQEQVFDKIFNKAMEAKDEKIGLGSLKTILSQIIESTTPNNAYQGNILADLVLTGQSNYISKIISRYKGDYNTIETAINVLALNDSKIGSKDNDDTSKIINSYTRLLKALETQDIQQFIIVSLEKDFLQTVSLAKSINPNFEINELALTAFDTNKDKSSALNAIIKAGSILPDQATGISGRSAYALLEYVTPRITLEEDPMHTSVLRTLTEYIIQHEGIERLREYITTDKTSTGQNIFELALAKKKGHVSEQHDEILEILLAPFSDDTTRANILSRACKNISNATVKAKLNNIADEISGYGLNYGSGLLNPDHVANIWYDNNHIRYISDNQTSTIKKKVNTEQASEYLSYLSRNPLFIIAGDELLNPDKVDSIWLEPDAGQNISLQLFTSGKATSISLPQERGQEIVKDMNKDDKFLYVDNVLINKSTTPYIYYDGDLLHQSVSADKFHHIKSSQDSAEKFLTTFTNETDSCVRTGNHVLNMNNISMLWFDEKQKQLCFSIQGQVYGPDSSEDYNGIEMTAAEAKKVIDQASKTENMVNVENNLINLKNISYIKKFYPVDQPNEITLYVALAGEHRIITLDTPKKSSTDLFAQLKEQDNMMTIDNKSINLDKAVNIFPAKNASGLTVITDSGETSLYKSNANIKKEDIINTLHKKGFISINSNDRDNDELVQVSQIVNFYEKDASSKKKNAPSSDFRIEISPAFGGTFPVYSKTNIPLHRINHILSEQKQSNAQKPAPLDPKIVSLQQSWQAANNNLKAKDRPHWNIQHAEALKTTKDLFNVSAQHYLTEAHKEEVSIEAKKIGAMAYYNFYNS